MHAVYLVGDLELRHDLVNIDRCQDVDDRLTTDVVALNIQQLQRLVLVQCGRQRLLSLRKITSTAGCRLTFYN